MHSWRNGACIVSKTSCLQVKPWWLIHRRSNYSIADYTCLMSGKQLFPTLERKAQPKCRISLHFLAELGSLRIPPPTQIALSPPPPHCGQFHNTNSNHLEVHNIDEIKKQHACQSFWPTSRDEFQQHTPSLWAQQQLHLCCIVCVCVRERGGRRVRTNDYDNRSCHYMYNNCWTAIPWSPIFMQTTLLGRAKASPT